MKTRLFVVPLVGLIGLALAVPAQSKVFTVSSAQELKAALVEAQSNGASDVINLLNGNYVGIDGQPFAFDSPEGFDLSLVGNELDPTQVILSGTGTDNVLILRNAKNGGTFTLKGLTIVGGGQGLKTDNANIRIEFCAFNGQTLAGEDSGADFPPVAGEKMTILSSVFTGQMPPAPDSNGNLGSIDPAVLKQGGNWVLLGTSEAITEMSRFDQFNAVWSYQNGQWKVYSPKQDIKIRAQTKGVAELDEIPAHSGFWVWRD